MDVIIGPGWQPDAYPAALTPVLYKTGWEWRMEMLVLR